MVESADRQVALISVHPEYADKLLSGEKRVELRKTRFSRDLTHLLIYATAPLSAVLGWVRVAGVDHAPPTPVWERHKTHAGISRRAFRDYFRGRRLATAIRVDSPSRLERPLKLSEIDPELRAPQSFCYLSAAATSRIWDESLSDPPDIAKRGCSADRIASNELGHRGNAYDRSAAG